jgi:hypothetical protein
MIDSSIVVSIDELRRSFVLCINAFLNDCATLFDNSCLRLNEPYNVCNPFCFGIRLYSFRMFMHIEYLHTTRSHYANNATHCLWLRHMIDWSITCTQTTCTTYCCAIALFCIRVVCDVIVHEFTWQSHVHYITFEYQLRIFDNRVSVLYIVIIHSTIAQRSRAYDCSFDDVLRFAIRNHMMWLFSTRFYLRDYRRRLWRTIAHTRFVVSFNVSSYRAMIFFWSFERVIFVIVNHMIAIERDTRSHCTMRNKRDCWRIWKL